MRPSVVLGAIDAIDEARSREIAWWITCERDYVHAFAHAYRTFQYHATVDCALLNVEFLRDEGRRRLVADRISMPELLCSIIVEKSPRA